ncbi:hypothetical protein MERGE_002242 [Pneumocystis wakefieldiae]|uniref:glutamate--tRNA ligase n=1 Tax=Pneumocystis wakefieldiae TaxID=38082 RepID=A0A899G0R3_9ASCO|nr:hypothetical protein MERGE_002242 [Pneumocystis wakefieldiae]
MSEEKSPVLNLSIQKTPIPYGIFLVTLWVNQEPQTIHINYVNSPYITEDNKVEGLSFQKCPGDCHIFGAIPILKELLRYLREPLKNEESILKWAEYSMERISISSFNDINPVFLYLDQLFSEKNALIDDQITLADWMVWSALRGNVYCQGIIKKNKYHFLNRWYLMIESDAFVSQAVQLLIKEITSRKCHSKGRNPTANYDIGLQDAIEGKVVTRFPPEPSGYLHIGHAKAAILNEYFAKKYRGKLIVRFDDTNPSKEKEEFQEAILKDLESLGIIADQVSFSSDYFDKTYDLCIKKQMQGIESKRRQRSIEESLEIFYQMREATEIGLLNCIRAKISVNSPNKALRDPVIYRCNTIPHHRTGTTWKIYPTYDFCCPIVDSIEGVTHALRTNEYKDRNAQYQWMIKALNLRKVHIWEFSRINFVRTLLSKRKLQQFVDDKRVSGWDDPRMPTILGIRRRGMTIEALKQFIISQGPSKNVLNLDWSSIWAINKKIIDPIAPRYAAVNSDNLVKVFITNGPDSVCIEERPKHKKNPQVGMKKVSFYKDIIINQEDALTFNDNEEDLNTIDSIEMELHLEGDFKTTEKKITWLADLPYLIDAELVDFDYLIIKDKLEEEDRLEDFLTPCTEFHLKIKVDDNFLNLSKSDIIQLERKGYFICDQPCDNKGKGLVLFRVPDGKVVNKYGVKKKEN